MSKKALRDPNAPKRNLSAYLLYQNAMREQFKALNPGMTFGQLAKYTSAMYAEMPPAEKEMWMERAEQDKTRYLEELNSYQPPPGYDSKGDALNATVETVGKRASRGKSEKDVNAPKRNMSAYLLYQNAMREQFKRDNPGMTFGQLAKYTSHMYKNLTAEEKATWQTKAEEDKQRYETEIALYVSPPGYDSKGNLLEEHRPKRRSKRAPRDPDAPKRASGAYVFFTNEMRPIVMEQFPGIKFVEMGRLLGERWRALTDTEKARYETMAQEDKIRFQAEMQSYTATQALQQQAEEQELAAQQQQQLLQAQQITMAHHAPHASAGVMPNAPLSSNQIQAQHYIDPHHPAYYSHQHDAHRYIYE